MAEVIGAFVVAVAVVILEYFVVKPLAEGRGQPSQSASTHYGDINQTLVVDQSTHVHQVIWNRISVVQGHPAESSSEGGSSGANEDSPLAWLFALSCAMVVLGAIGTVFFARYGSYIRVTLGGVGLGTLVTLGMLWLWQKRALSSARLPVRTSLLFVSPALTGISLVAASFFVDRGVYKNYTLEQIADSIDGLSFFDATEAVIERMGFDVVFFAGKAIGMSILLLLSVFTFLQVLAITAAFGALGRRDPRPWQGWVVEKLIPARPVTQALFLSFVVVAALLLASGYLWIRTVP